MGTAAVLPGQILRHGHRLALVHQRVLGKAPRAAPHDARADFEAGDAGAELLHLAGSIGACRLGRGSRAHELAAVQPGGAYPHAHLLRAGLGRLGLSRFDDRLAAAGADEVGSHGPAV